jgi:Forkhead domain
MRRLNARAGLVEEEEEEEEEEVAPEERKPPYSYASLIRLAILNADGQKATLSDIYRWIQVLYSTKRAHGDKVWQQ